MEISIQDKPCQPTYAGQFEYVCICNGRPLSPFLTSGHQFPFLSEQFDCTSETIKARLFLKSKNIFDKRNDVAFTVSYVCSDKALRIFQRFISISQIYSQTCINDNCQAGGSCHLL
jgi:hypothetical protein